MITLEETNDRIKIANLFNYYVYDMSEFLDWQPAESGLFVDDPEQIEIHEYWQRPDRFPYLIKLHGELAGFALVRFLKEQDTFDVGQFFVLRRFKGKGVGAGAFYQLIKDHPGQWQVRVLKENVGALQFWQKVIPRNAIRTIQFDEEDEMVFFNFLSSSAHEI